ncbi:hypothetical protein [Hymenobacter guriensis]|uniref:Uncharacterized protein n=1 Tax=Hymenobacter guriensis TaxID=2793065 RepID=A0ABS0L3J3_9BACT|nr:hypothetical protein [Hymenobacter guriensis]MBG8553994.1 hypothetical protein [Hymenobacter guriensis]
MHDNRLHYSAWRQLLRRKAIYSHLYLWPNSACAYPGFRRKVGKHEKAGTAGAHSLLLDKSGNQMGHKPWELLATTASDFKKLRKQYELVHLFPHKSAEWKKLLPQLPDEVRNSIPLAWQRRLKAHGLPGLFSNPANTCFLPSALVRPTDGQSMLRQVLWKQALRLYGSSSLLPQPIANAFKLWLRDQPDPSDLQWSTAYHGEHSALQKLLVDRSERLAAFQKQ